MGSISEYILDNKMLQKLKLLKNINNKKSCPKFIQLNEKIRSQKLIRFLTWKIDFGSPILTLLDSSVDF